MLSHPAGKSADQRKRAVGGNCGDGCAITDFAGRTAVVPPGVITAIQSETPVEFGVLFHSFNVIKHIKRQKNTHNQG